MRRIALSWLAALPREGALVLDAACGAGGFLAALSRRLPSARGVGLDVSWDAVRLSRSAGVAAVRGSAAKLPFPPEVSDAVLLHDVLQHLPPAEDERALAEAFRVLTPGGLLSIRTNFGAPDGVSPSRFRRYDRESLASLVAAAGFVVVKHRVVHPVAALLGRWMGRGGGGGRHVGSAAAERHGHTEGGLDVLAPAPAVNALLDLYSRVEDPAVARIPFALPVGDAQLLLARKPRPRSGSPAERP